MGCDIHAVVERVNKWESGREEWLVAGEPDYIGRDYTLFAVLGNVRNGDDIPFIGEYRLEKSEYGDWACSDLFADSIKAWNGNGHSHGYVTLKELKEFDINQTYNNSNLITSKDENGKITSTCGSTTGKHLGKVGETTIFGVWGTETWDKLIKDLTHIKERYELDDDKVRLVFFFDN